MTESILTRERILEAAEDVLRRYGPSKATVIDVARALGVSHGSVYKHFASKAELRDAVTKIWLARVIDPLDEIVAEDAPSPERLHRWLTTLFALKRSRVLDDPELFATYSNLAAEAREVVMDHREHLASQISRIIADGVARGEFAVTDPSASGRAVLSAMVRFQNPAHASEWLDPGIDDAFEEVWALILSGLKACAV